jgi:crossover junction endodeoxyribonuclease RusA
MEVNLTVHGRPAGAGSKTFYRTPEGKGVPAPASIYQKPWQEAVKWAFLQSEYNRMIRFSGPVIASLGFTFLRPKGHFNEKGLSAKGKRTPYPTTKTDLDKLSRATLDALTGLVWDDDKQVVMLHAIKIWGAFEGCIINVSELTD